MPACIKRGRHAGTRPAQVAIVRSSRVHPVEPVMMAAMATGDRAVDIERAFRTLDMAVLGGFATTWTRRFPSLVGKLHTAGLDAAAMGDHGWSDLSVAGGR